MRDWFYDLKYYAWDSSKRNRVIAVIVGVFVLVSIGVFVYGTIKGVRIGNITDLLPK